MRIYTIDSNPASASNRARFAYPENVEKWVAGITGSDAKGRAASEWAQTAKGGDALIREDFVVFVSEINLN